MGVSGYRTLVFSFTGSYSTIELQTPFSYLSRARTYNLWAKITDVTITPWGNLCFPDRTRTHILRARISRATIALQKNMWCRADLNCQRRALQTLALHWSYYTLVWKRLPKRAIIGSVPYLWFPLSLMSDSNWHSLITSEDSCSVTTNEAFRSQYENRTHSRCFADILPSKSRLAMCWVDRTRTCMMSCSQSKRLSH